MFETLGIEGYYDGVMVGRGGTSHVFKATNETGDTVAVKVLSGVWTETDLRRFNREQEAMHILSDAAGVVPLLDSGTTSHGAPFFVMPYFANGSLHDKIKTGHQYEETEAINITANIGRVLSHAHSLGVSHRDLKPANILIDDLGNPWLTDFGITQIDDGRSHSTTAAYTPGYAPPESFTEGRQKANGQTIDTYGLAATLWALLAGRSPFSNPTSEQSIDTLVKLRRICEDPVGTPRENVTSNTQDVIEKAMQKNPADRHQTINELITQLTHTNSEATINTNYKNVKPKTPAAHNPQAAATPKTKKLKKLTKPITIAAAAAILIATTVGTYRLLQDNTGQETAAPQSTTTTNGKPASTAKPTTAVTQLSENVALRTYAEDQVKQAAASGTLSRLVLIQIPEDIDSEVDLIIFEPTEGKVTGPGSRYISVLHNEVRHIDGPNGKSIINADGFNHYNFYPDGDPANEIDSATVAKMIDFALLKTPQNYPEEPVSAEASRRAIVEASLYNHFDRAAYYGRYDAVIPSDDLVFFYDDGLIMVLFQLKVKDAPEWVTTPYVLVSMEELKQIDGPDGKPIVGENGGFKISNFFTNGDLSTKVDERVISEISSIVLSKEVLSPE